MRIYLYIYTCFNKTVGDKGRCLFYDPGSGSNREDHLSSLVSLQKFSDYSEKKMVCLALLQIVNRTVTIRTYVTSNSLNFNVFYLFVLKSISIALLLILGLQATSSSIVVGLSSFEFA